MIPFRPILQIEPTDHCNLKCPMCTPQFSRKGGVHGDTPMGYMPLQLFKGIIDDIARSDLLFDHMILQWLGEPTLHPGLMDMLEYAHKGCREKFSYFRIDTNGILFGREMVERLIDIYLYDPLKPILIVFSLDAITPSTYKKVKGGSSDTFERVMHNIFHFIEKRKGIKTPSVNLNIEFQLVLQKENADEVKRFIDFWDRYLMEDGRGRGYNEVMIKRLAVGTGGKEQEEADNLYEETLKRFSIKEKDLPHLHIKVWKRRTWANTSGKMKVRPPCAGPFITPVIRWDGLLSPCCVDIKGELSPGNVNERGFIEMWKGKEMTDLRIAHLMGDLEGLKLCIECGGIGFYSLDEEDIRIYLTSIGRKELIDSTIERLKRGVSRDGG